MATYISLIKFTRQGITTIKEGPARLDAGKETLKTFGSELKAFYLTMGGYDIVAISEAPRRCRRRQSSPRYRCRWQCHHRDAARVQRGRVPRDRRRPSLSEPERSLLTEPSASAQTNRRRVDTGRSIQGGVMGPSRTCS
jgi:hypothetical protein